MSLLRGGAPLHIANGIREFAVATPGRTAVVDGSRSLTYAQLDERASRLAQALLGRGLQPGDRVGVLLGNRMEYPEVAAGVAKAGLVMVPLNPRMTAPEAQYVLDHSGARALVLDDALAQVAGTADVDHVLSMDGTSMGQDYEQELAAADARDPRVPVDEQEPFCIAYTSGTTGRPKGVLISHRSRSLTFYCTALEWGLGPGRRTVAVAPMYHGAGFAFGFAAVHTGGTVHMLRAFDPERLLAVCAASRAQSVFLVPTHATMLRALDPQDLSRHDLSALETLYFNAAALPQVLKEWVLDAFPRVGLHELYGSTEAGIVTDLRPTDVRRKPGSVGTAWFMTEVRVVREDGTPVAAGEPGELFSRSPFLMNGYLDDEEATAACTTEDGFLSSGDIAVVDDERFVSIVDRKKDLVISGGVNVYPREVEEVVLQHPAVVDVAVVGLPDDTWGERVTAFVVVSGGVETTHLREQLDRHARTQLSGYKVPRQWELVDALPRNAAGKVLKRDLRGGSATAR